MRTKDCINWSSKEEITWMAKLLFKKPMTVTQITVECQKHYGKLKIGAQSIFNQLARISKIEDLNFGKVDEKRYGFPAELDEETLDLYLDMIEVSSLTPSSGKDRKKKKRGMNIETLNIIINIFDKLKSNNFEYEFKALYEYLAASFNFKLKRDKIDYFNEELADYFDGQHPFYFSGKSGNQLYYAVSKINPQIFENCLKEIIRNRKGEASEESVVIMYEASKLKKDEILFSRLIYGCGSKGIEFDKVLTRWAGIYPKDDLITQEELSYISKDLLKRCSDSYKVRNRHCYITDLEGIFKVIDPAQLTIEAVIYYKNPHACLEIPADCTTEIKKSIDDRTGFLTITSRKSSKVLNYLRKLYVEQWGEIVYPKALREQVESEWIDYKTKFYQVD
jgi:hypothetical protein